MAEVYSEDAIRTLDWNEHIRLRPGMYIGKLGDGSSPDDGIYVLLKEVIDNAVDEFIMGNGRTVEVVIKDQKISVRDYGRGIPLGKVVECVSKINTGAKYDSKVFKKTVGLNGVGSKAVNALSSYFKVQSIRDGECKVVEFERGNVVLEEPIKKTEGRNGTMISFCPDEKIFGNYHFIPEHIEKLKIEAEKQLDDCLAKMEEAALSTDYEIVYRGFLNSIAVRQLEGLGYKVNRDGEDEDFADIYIINWKGNCYE